MPNQSLDLGSHLGFWQLKSLYGESSEVYSWVCGTAKPELRHWAITLSHDKWLEFIWNRVLYYLADGKEAVQLAAYIPQLTQLSFVHLQNILRV